MERFKNAMPVNWDLLANPVNWIIVWLMLALFSVMLGLVLSSIDAPMKTEE